jgi:peptidyl-prolyl cis-trans isomerase C
MNSIRILGAAALLLLAACQPGADSATTAASNDPGAQPVAIVNGKPISTSLFDTYVKGVSGKSVAELSDEQRAQALDNLIRAEVVADQATKDGIANEPEAAAILELSRLNVLQQESSQRFLEGKTPTPQELRAEYETQLAGMPKLEYRARHILVATEDFAKKLIEQLNKGARFDDLAKRESIDSSKDQGGDLGWFTPDRMVAPFSQAVAGMKKGEYTQTPVQTQFGWHVIALEDTREVTPPPYDSVVDRLNQIVQAKKFKAYTDELMKTAKVEKM